MTAPARALTPVVLIGTLLALAPGASADQTYRTERIQLSGSGGLSGTVVNIHAEGPRIYAQERYHLTGGTPSSTYSVQLLLHASTSCGDDSFLTVPLTTITANRNGVAHGGATLPPEAVTPLLPGQPYGVVWEVTDAQGVVVLRSACQGVALD